MINLDPPTPSTSSNFHTTPSQGSTTTQTPNRTYAGRSRTLRARPSDPGPGAGPTAAPALAAAPDPSTSPSSKSTRVPQGAAVRRPSHKELDSIIRRLGDETVRARRDELVHDKEAELKQVMDSHDTATREKFHMERYPVIIQGWDPERAKTDNSPVFLEWKDLRHNLLNLLPNPAPVAGPSSAAGTFRPHTYLPSRTTRRKAHEQSEMLSSVAAPLVPTTPVNGHAPSNSKGKGKDSELPLEVTSSTPHLSAKGKGKLVEPVVESPSNGPGKGRRRISEISADEVDLQETPVSRKLGKKPKEEPASLVMAPPPVPEKKGKGARRVTMDSRTPEVVSGAAVELGDVIEDPGGNGKGKKRGRLSLSNPPAAKKGRTSMTPTEQLQVAPSPSVETPTETPREPSPSSLAPAPLPSFAHLPFPPPPHRPKERFYGPKRILYTDPSQAPASKPKHEGRISPILESYIHLEDSGPPPDLRTLEARALKDGYHRARVMYLQAHGRLQRLLDEATADDSTLSRAASQRVQKPSTVQRKTDHQDSLMAHMVQVRNAMLNEAKYKPVVCKRIAKMIQTYWERIEGREERERLAEEKERKRIGKEMMKGLRKRWALAVKIIRAKVLEAQRIEQDRLGKEHLQNILQRSTGLLEAQVAGPEEEISDDESDEAESDITAEDLSAAEESEKELDVDGDEGDDDAEENTENGDKDDPEEDDDQRSNLPTSSIPPDSMFDDDEDAQSDNAEMEDGNEDSEEEDEEEGEVENQADLRFLISEDIDMSDEVPEGAGSNGHRVNKEVPAMVAVAENVSVAQVDIATSDAEPIIQTEPGQTGAISSAMPKGDHTEPPQSSVAAVQVSVTNGDTTPPLTNPVPRSRRARKVVLVKPVDEIEDPDANDVEFSIAPTSEMDEQDEQLDIEMEDDDRSDREADSEDEGLLKDADIPIEELLKRYGYPVPNETKADMEEAAKPEPGEQESSQNGEVSTDKSLVDEALPATPVSPQLIIEGKRQRRARSVWSPDPVKPQQLASRRPKIELLEPESERESTPELSSEEDSDEDEEEDGEGGNEVEGMQVDGRKEEGTRIRTPFLLRGTLRPYQQGGLEWLASLWQNGMNGILADEMGLGKTIQTISLLAYLACDKGIWGQHLIIVPTSVILNWEMEFKKFLPGMKVLTYYGNQKERKEKRIGWHTENAWQVCITSYQIVLADQHIFRRKSWCYMILDEAHNIKNFRSQRWQTLLGFKAQRRLLLTGTPLQNNLMELWSLLYFLMPGGIGADASAVVGFANHRDFMDWFSNPMDKAVESGDAMDEETLATVAKLHTLLRPFILRRLKAEVEKQLPGKFEHVVYCRLSKRQRFLYDEFMSRASTKEALTSGGYLGVMNTLMQLRKVCNHPDLFEVRPVRTSFAMECVAAEFQPKELLLRRRFLQQDEANKLDILSLGLGVTTIEHESGWVCRTRSTLDASNQLPYAIEPIVVRRGKPPAGPKKDTRTVEGWLKYRAWADEQASILRWRSLRDINRRRCSLRPIYGSTFLKFLGGTPNYLLPLDVKPRRNELFAEHRPPAGDLGLVLSLPERAKIVEPIIDFFAVIPPNVVARDLATYALPGLEPISHPALTDPSFDTLHRSTVKLQIAFPDSSLLQYDCGKLQTLATMLRDLKAVGHRVLIFTQMTRVLDILEIFLSYNGHRYLRLDGSTKIEDRQIITERFNSDPRYFVFIASSRSGGVGINLTGADTVFFYDSDWNPSMDRQCMDRAHRIGQTREVHIYRFVSSHTVEENMLRKAEQKRLLDKMVIQEGGFNNDWWGRVGWKDMFGDVSGSSEKPGLGGDEDGQHPSSVKPLGAEGGDTEGVIDVAVEGTPIAEDVERLRPRAGEERELARVLAQVEDEEDVQAARMAQGEGELDFQEFEDARAAAGADVSGKEKKKGGKVAFERRTEGSATPLTLATPAFGVIGEGDEQEEQELREGEREEDGRAGVYDDGGGDGSVSGEGEEEDEDGIGGVEDYMLKWVKSDWEYFVGYRA